MRRDNVNSEDEYRKERKERYSWETENNAGKYTTRGKILRDARALHVDEIIKGKLFSSPHNDESLVFTYFKAILDFLLRDERKSELSPIDQSRKDRYL